MRILLIRHGQIKANKTGHWHGSTDSPLTWKGRRQAKRTGRWLQTNQTLDAVYTSPLQRCRDTARFAAPGHTAQTLPELAEMHIGDWEEMPFQELHESHDFFARSTNNPDFTAPNGESLRQVGQRMTQALEQIVSRHQPEQNILVVSHGVALGACMAKLLEADVSRWRDYRFANCSISELNMLPQPQLISLNQTFHL